MTADRPLRIAHVTTERGHGGGEVQLGLLIAGLARSGHRQTLVCPAGAALGALAAAAGAEVIAMPLRTYVSFLDVWRLRRILREHDVAHLHTGRASWLGSLAARSVRVPRVVTRRTMRAVAPGWRARLVYGPPDVRVVAVSNSVADVLRRGGVDDAHLEVVLDSVHLDRIPVRAGRAATRATLGVADGEFLALAAGKLAHGKGFDVLIAAIARLPDPSVRCFIAGDGPERAALQAQIERAGLLRRVTLLGSRDDVGDLLAACDVFVMPSRHEGLGNAAMEALGRERPVVASRVGGLAELVEDDVNGLLAPPEDPTALAAAITRLRVDADLRARLAAAGPARLDRGLRPEQGVAAYRRIYAGLVAARRGSTP